MSAENVALMWAACARPDADCTTWLVLADALDEADQHDEARLIREQDFCLIGGRMWPERIPGWFLVYEPNADPGWTDAFYGRECDGTYFVTRWGMVVKGEERARQLVAARTVAIAAMSFPEAPDFVVDPFSFGNLDGTNQEHEDLAEDIASRFVPW
jgi:uncharacterized protein (TIGR02996 family)